LLRREKVDNLAHERLLNGAFSVVGVWAAVQPFLDAWGNGQPDLYQAGSCGPAAADALLTRDGRAWLGVA
jgi:glucose-6-phosphate 1-dehydrogenase